MQKIELNLFEEDVWLLFLSSFRYALGRETYMPIVITNIIKANMDKLSVWQMKRIADEVLDYKETYGNIGASFDTEMWLKFASDLEAEAAERLAKENGKRG